MNSLHTYVTPSNNKATEKHFFVDQNRHQDFTWKPSTDRGNNNTFQVFPVPGNISTRLRREARTRNRMFVTPNPNRDICPVIETVHASNMFLSVFVSTYFDSTATQVERMTTTTTQGKTVPLLRHPQRLPQRSYLPRHP